MKFKVDENLPEEFAQILRWADYDAVTVIDQNLAGKADALVAQACRRERRILVTLDRGFADIRAYPPQEYPGLIVLALHHQDKGNLLASFRRVIPSLEEEPIAHRLWIVEEHRLKIRGEDTDSA